MAAVYLQSQKEEKNKKQEKYQVEKSQERDH